MKGKEMLNVWVKCCETERQESKRVPRYNFYYL